jgi:hypothetical protein
MFFGGNLLFHSVVIRIILILRNEDGSSWNGYCLVNDRIGTAAEGGGVFDRV